MCADAGELGRGDADRRYDALTLNNEEGLANAHPEASLGRAVWPSRRQVWSPAGRRPMTRVVAASDHGHAAQAREVRRGEGRREVGSLLRAAVAGGASPARRVTAARRAPPVWRCWRARPAWR